MSASAALLPENDSDLSEEDMLVEALRILQIVNPRHQTARNILLIITAILMASVVAQLIELVATLPPPTPHCPPDYEGPESACPQRRHVSPIQQGMLALTGVLSLVSLMTACTFCGDADRNFDALTQMEKNKLNRLRDPESPYQEGDSLRMIEEGLTERLRRIRDATSALVLAQIRSRADVAALASVPSVRVQAPQESAESKQSNRR